ncbi:SDR family oxidoreductase [Nonomuraea jabiensis]|uniref:NAD(P)-dependent dehydrogenase (Short-subunit alcohol dehydrogenase family) n=1 Tax=Nonomuraea jabiensis TaxID=882448 RepID=A0A7W9GAD1_9ACTN|nr:SDR family oxidoreductase [Nonomuraea jabiensis]MBB5780138.1 NAD(P)-dependent dehydrogenase (short-subunit alcohol dehydrogenase family) [Nonomuraea jabiensis]
MKISGSVALVTGANRGLGAAFAQALLDRGARTVYAAARNPATITGTNLTPVELDVTDPAAVAAAAERCGDVDLLINNAGISRSGSPDLDSARAEMDTNYFGTLSMSRAFAPVLARNGGGALVNVLSVLSFITLPQASGYAASKAAAWSLTNALRLELKEQGTHVLGVHAGYIDTDMAAHVTGPKITPAEVVAQTLDALETGAYEVLADAISRQSKAGLSGELERLYPALATSS